MSRAVYSRVPDEDEDFNQRLKPQVQNAKGKNVYIFGEGDVQESTEDLELNVLVNRGHASYKSTSQNDNHEFRQIKLEPGDTLQAIAIKFRCPVAELKKANGLIHDSQFYGLKELKIPFKAHNLNAQDQLEAYIRERDQRGEKNGKKRNAGASIVSSETSDEDPDTSHSRASPSNTVKKFEPHSDPEDMTSISLLHPTRKHSRDPSQHERRKFEKFMNRKDGIIADIMRSAQERADSLESITRSMEEPVLSQRKASHCVGFPISPFCVILTALLTVVVLPVILFVSFRVLK